MGVRARCRSLSLFKHPCDCTARGTTLSLHLRNACRRQERSALVLHLADCPSPLLPSGSAVLSFKDDPREDASDERAPKGQLERTARRT